MIRKLHLSINEQFLGVKGTYLHSKDRSWLIQSYINQQSCCHVLLDQYAHCVRCMCRLGLCTCIVCHATPLVNFHHRWTRMKQTCVCNNASVRSFCSSACTSASDEWQPSDLPPLCDSSGAAYLSTDPSSSNNISTPCISTYSRAMCPTHVASNRSKYWTSTMSDTA